MSKLTKTKTSITQYTRNRIQVPWVAVLPFKNISSDSQDDYFCDGITSDLITDLSRFPDIAVIASHSSFIFKNKSAKVETIAGELGVQYIVEGSIQRSGETVRVNVQLIQAQDGVHLWAERFNRPFSELFALYDEIVVRLVTSLIARVEISERDRAARKATENLEAYDHCLQARIFGIGGINKAISLRSIILNRQFNWTQALPLHMATWLTSLFRLALQVGRPIRNAFCQKHLSLLEKLLTLNLRIFVRIGILGLLPFYTRQFSQCLASYEKATQLNPNCADLLADKADALIHVGRLSDAAEYIARAKRLNPFSPDWYEWIYGIAAYHQGRFDDALDAFNRVQNTSNFLRCDLIATFVKLGRLDDARSIAQLILRQHPNYRLSNETLRPFRELSVLNEFVSTLRKAGLPD